MAALFCSCLGYYPHFMNIIRILGIYPHFMDIIRIGQIVSYLALNVHHVLHSFVLVVDIICIGHIILQSFLYFWSRVSVYSFEKVKYI